MGQIYQYNERIEINTTRNELLSYYLDKDLRKKWQKNLLEVNVINDEAQEGRVFELIYQSGQHHMKMKETLISISLPESFEVLYEVTGVKNLCKNQITEIDGLVSWVMDVTFEFMDQAPYPIDEFKASTKKSMKILKEYLENNH